jgi:CheY-like chemotaxis protein
MVPKFHGRVLTPGLGFAVNWVSTAPEALAALQNGEVIDLVLSDIVMPGGIDFIAERQALDDNGLPRWPRA